MRKLTFEDYENFIKERKKVTIDDQEIELKEMEVKRLTPAAEELTDVSTTVWSFPKRGAWATHKGDYRGNWPPQLARALILMYTEKGETVLDPMVGSGTTCIEAKLLGRNCIGVDVNYESLMLTLHRLYYLEKALERLEKGGLSSFVGSKVLLDGISLEDIKKAKVEIYHGDARNLDKIADESVQLVATHPPYWGIIKYNKVDPNNLSAARTLEDFLRGLRDVAKETYRVLEKGRHAAILIGDTRKRKHYVPISNYTMLVFLSVGFLLREEVIKIQHKMKTTREVWSKMKERDFLLIKHEKLFVFRKPVDQKDLKEHKYSAFPEWLEVRL